MDIPPLLGHFTFIKQLFLFPLFFFNPQQPKVFGVKFSLREIRRIFSIKIRSFKLWKMPK